jgi:hypothetical protein
VYGRRLRALQPVLLGYTDAELRRLVGLGGYVALRYIRWCLKVCVFTTISFNLSCPHSLCRPWAKHTNVDEGTKGDGARGRANQLSEFARTKGGGRGRGGGMGGRVITG